VPAPIQDITPERDAHIISKKAISFKKISEELSDNSGSRKGSFGAPNQNRNYASNTDSEFQQKKITENMQSMNNYLQVDWNNFGE
jgi:hypothetical protein